MERRGAVGSGRSGEVPPGPRNFPVLGATPTVEKDPLKRFSMLARDYGDISYYRVGSIPLYMLGYPEDIASVLVGEHQRYMKDEITHELSRFLGRGLLTSEGRFWRRQRRIAAPSFQRRHIERFADTMVERSVAHISEISEGRRDIHPDMMALTLDIVLHTLFGDATIPDLSDVADIVETAMADFKKVHLSWRRLVPRRVWHDEEERMVAADRQLDDLLLGIIAQRRERGVDGDDLLGRLLSAQDDDGSTMDDRQLRDELATIFLAGHETTALALSFSVLMLAEHPQAQRAVAEEVTKVLAGRPATLADVPALVRTEAVARETMRLYPPVYTIGREALQDCTIGGFVVPRGAQVLMPQWSVHRDDRWYDDPEAFRPERWLDGLADRLPRFAYFPFGGGPRVCVGNHFAMLEVVLALATWVQAFEATPDPQFEFGFSPSVTLRPTHGVSVHLRRR